MKKILSICLSIIIMSVLPVNTYAAQNKDLSDEEKTRVIQLGDMIYDSSAGSYTFVLNETADSKSVSRVKSSITECKSTTLVLVPITEEAEETLLELINNIKTTNIVGNSNYSVNARARGSNMIYDSDSAGCLSAYLTVQYSKTTLYGKEYVSLTGVSGGYTADGSGARLSSGVSVASQSVVYGASGIGINGRMAVQRNTYNPGRTIRSFSIVPPSNWVAVAAESEVTMIGANYTITLRRGTGSWTCYLENNLSF